MTTLRDALVFWSGLLALLALAGMFEGGCRMVVEPGKVSWIYEEGRR